MPSLKKIVLPALTASALLAAAAPAAAAPSVEIEGKRLVIRGGPEADSVGLSVPAGEPNLLRIDLDGDGRPQFELPRRHLDSILVAPMPATTASASTRFASSPCASTALPATTPRRSPARRAPRTCACQRPARVSA